MKRVRIGCGAGCCKDRIEPVEEMLKYGNLDYLIYEMLSEGTYANFQAKKYENLSCGYNDTLIERMTRTMPLAYEKGTKLITNIGAANPAEAVAMVAQIAQEQQLHGLKIALVQGDNILPQMDRYLENERWQLPGSTIAEIRDRIVYANVYLGCYPIKDALAQGADVVITGRIADAALFMGPLVYTYGWTPEDLSQMGQATLVGHLLECCGQVTGGYYADPGYKEVPDLARLGFPIAEVSESGDFVLTKVEGSGGLVSVDVCKEQLLYEIGDPSCYITPDSIVDFRNVTFEQIDKDQVLVKGAVSHGVPETLKANVGYENGYHATGIVFFSGTNSLKLAELCGDMIEQRLEIVGIKPLALRMDYVGFNALCGSKVSHKYGHDTHSEIALRMAVRVKTEAEAEHFTHEFGFLYTNGPAGSTGVQTSIKSAYGVTSIFVPRHDVQTTVDILEVE